MRATGMVHERDETVLCMKNGLALFFLLITSAMLAQLVPHAYTYNIDNFPEVYGGKPEWKRFLHDHLRYPKQDLADKYEGTVKIYFVVTKEGKPARAKVIESVSTNIDNEALRLLSLLEWIPTRQNDSVVNAEHSVEINFSISKYKKAVKERGYETAAFEDLPMDTTFTVYESADKGPSFADPEKTFPEFVYSSLEYPEMAARQGLEGNITMNFIIEPDGRTSNIRITKGIGGGCNEEAIRVVGKTKWKPAQKNGRYVRYRMYYTMLFNLKNSFKDNSNGSQRAGGQ
jgi:TonB family protein